MQDIYEALFIPCKQVKITDVKLINAVRYSWFDFDASLNAVQL